MRQDGTWNGVWGSTVGALIQAETVNFHGGPDGLAPAPADPWVESAWDSTVWQHIPAGRNAGFFRQHVAEAVATLARVREAAESGTAADPWRDDGFVPRFAEAVEWLLGEPDPGRPLDLYPAEAALLVLMPFLHRVQCLRLTASLAPAVEPGRLGRITAAPPLRTAFEVFSEGHDLLVERGRRRPEAAEPIGWWLFHRWLAQREEFSDPTVVQQLLRAVGPSAEALGETLDPRRVCRLLHGLRRGPGVCDREYLDSLPADDSARIRRGGQQRIRDQRIGVLLALAHGMSRGITALPRIVVEHVGIPFPVDLAQLRQTLASSGWGGSHDLPVLRAECRHEAVIEGLREYTAHADELLATVRRAAHERITQPMPRLPARLSADEVTPSLGGGGGGSRWLSDPWKSPRGHPPDHILLWRLLAHRPHALLAQLAESCPEITEVKAVLPALPSDRDLLSAPGLDSGELFWNWSKDSRCTADHLRSVAGTWGAALPALVHRARSLGALPCPAPAKFAELMEEMEESATDSAASIASEWRRCGIDVPETYIELATAARRDPLLQRDLGRAEGAFGWVDPEETVPPGHIAKAGLLLGLPVSAVCARLREYGLRVDAEGLPERPGAEVATLLSERADGLWPWLSRSQEIPPGHVAAAGRALALGPREVLDRLAGLGFTTPMTMPGDAPAAAPAQAGSLCAHLRLGTPQELLAEACDRPHACLRIHGSSATAALLHPLDKELLRGDGPLEWAQVTTADAMPSAHVLVAARSLLMSPRALAERLIGYGVEVSCPDVPAGLSFASALELLRICEGEDMFLTIDCEVDLYDLIERSRAMKTSITRTVQWLRELGIPVPDLSETLRSALGRVPGRVGGI
ncbi:hypothetical protein AB0K71_26490 [Streptomyces syringium]|uniref:HD domain-containing protein n=1 Tax=Streptomyces syringium TaxID=76729 RepID=UPI0034170DD7